MQFQYTAKTSDGLSTAGVLEAPSLTQARQSLRDRGLFPLGVHEESRPQAISVPRARLWSRGKVRQADLLMVTSQLSIMCQSGIDLAEALKSVAQDCHHPVLKKSLQSIFEDVSSGTAASVAIGKHNDIFGEAYVASIAAAEASGTITNVLPRLADMLRNEIRLRSNLASVAAYPLVLMMVAGVVMTVLVFFVLPQFGKVFTNLGRPAPPVTAFLLDTAQLLRSNVLLILLSAGATGFALSQFVRTEAARRYWDKFVLNVRLVSHASRLLLAGRSFRLMGTMLQSGVPLLETVRLCKKSVRNSLFREMFADLERDVVNGNGIGGAISRASFVPLGAAQMIRTAEHTGKLDEVMQLIGEYYEEEGERLVKQVVKLLEPAIIVVMGVIVAGVVLSVILPLLDVSTITK